MKNFKSTKSDLVIQNGTVHIPSIFMFEDGPEELFPFLGECREENCTVVFDNEDIVVKPDNSIDRAYQNISLSIYAFLASTPEILSQKIRYDMNRDKMNWDNVVSESK